MSRGEVQNFPLAPHQKSGVPQSAVERIFKLFALRKSLSFFATTGFALFCHNTPLLHRSFTGKKILKAVLQKEFYTVSTGFSTGSAHLSVKKPSPFRFWKYRFFEGVFFPPCFSFFPFLAFFFPQWQKWYFLFLFCVAFAGESRQTLATPCFPPFCLMFVRRAARLCPL